MGEIIKSLNVLPQIVLLLLSDDLAIPFSLHLSLAFSAFAAWVASI
jgi:hypothetical protein